MCRYIDICTDNVRAMIGHIVGAVVKIKDNTKNCSSSHCVFHRRGLAPREMSSELMIVLNDALTIMNHETTS